MTGVDGVDTTFGEELVDASAFTFDLVVVKTYEAAAEVVDVAASWMGGIF